ncbi:beta strand repeat-containing protein [Desulfoglaeba alkanexedens]|uniref:Uncharacterized protein n=1 Tax=Desulfoglaeba alkanexedens ALDC TaxID=980445 RepID=A0A4P8L2Z5_9BACT|nr:hypothetical protein [Desulfoglaeba alkanexedens]QCQ21345.1 hypothetical protein FDQ92_03610 [Desulfoglaeba alkanexedens ALDC]
MALQGFDEAYYLEAKLAALQADPEYADEWANKTTDDLETFMADLGLTPETHYNLYGWKEGLNPNEFFDQNEYKLAKAKQMVDDGLYDSMQDALDAFEDAWAQDPYQHYLLYGAKEGVNPSNDFDASEYLKAKLAKLQADPQYADEWAGKTVEDVKDAFEASGLTPLTHYLAYGKDEGLTAPEVPVDEQVDESDLHAGETLTLTTGTDLFTPDAEVEADRTTANNDTIEGVSSALTSARTLNPTDQIDGAGGNDTLKVDMQSSFAGFTDGYVKNVETVELTNSGTISRDFNATGVTGVQSYVLNGAVSLAALGATDAAITLNGQQDDVEIGFAAKVTDGTADALTLNLNGVGKAEDTATTAIEFNRVDLTAPGIEELNLGVAGANVVNVDAAAVKAVTATGEGSLDASFNDNDNLKTIDASGVTGKVAVELDGLTEATTVKTGAGNDTIIAAEDELAVNAELDGGAGDDRLVLSGTGTVQYTMGNIETVGLGDGSLTFSAKNASGIQTIEATSAFAYTANFVNLGNIDLNFALGKNSSGDITADNAGTATVNVSGESDTTLILTKATGAILNVAKDSIYTAEIEALKAGSLEATIDGQLGISTDDAAEIYMPEATGAVFKATSTNASFVDLHAAKLVDLDIITAGDFTFREVSLAGLESLTVNTDGDFSIGDLAAIHSVDLSGTGTATLGALGATDLDYGITVNASELTDLTIGSINVGEGQSIELNVAEVAGDVTLGTVIEETVIEKTVTQTGEEVTTITGGATVGDGATGTISVHANGTQGAVTLGDLSAKTVTVDATGALGQVTVGTISGNYGDGGIDAETVNFTGSELRPNEVYVTASDSATLTGGIADDTFMLVADNGLGDTTQFTITGGLGDDQFLIDWDATLNGKAIATITDFEEGDTTNIAAETLGVFDDAEIALGVLQDAGFAPADADAEDIAFLDLGTDATYDNSVFTYDTYDTYDNSVFTYDGNTYAVVGDWDIDGTLTRDTHDAAFQDGEILIQLLGVQDADAINHAFGLTG